MSKRSKKYQLTEAIHDLLPSDKKYKIPIEKVVFKWFVTGRMGDGLRLTPEGMQAFDSTDIEYFDYPFFKEKLNARDYEGFNIHEFTLKLGKLIKCPFYLGVTDKAAYIKVYDSKIAMMISLYGGNLLDYIEAMEKKNE
jgi:hypothetical protein